MYLLVDWYGLYMGADRERRVFVSLYGPGSFNGFHMVTENEDGKKRVLQTCAEFNKKTHNGKKKEIDQFSKTKTQNALFYICMFIHLKFSFEVVQYQQSLFYSFFKTGCCHVQFSALWVWFIQNEHRLVFAFFLKPLYSISPLSIAWSTQRVFSPRRSNMICIFVFVYLIIDLRPFSSFSHWECELLRH